MMVREKSRFGRLIHYIKTHKTKSILIGVGVFLVLLYSAVFFIPKQVQFNYAGDTCVGQFTLFPDVHRATNTNTFNVRFEDKAKIGSFPLVSTKTCFVPTIEPSKGEVTVGTAPFGGLIARKNFVVSVSAPPVANTKILDKPLAVSRPLIMPLSHSDAVFSYRVEAEGQEASCTGEDKSIACDIPALELEQGKEYRLGLTRQFRGSKKRTLVEKEIETLRAVTIKKASLRHKQTVYDKPNKFVFTADKSLARASVSLKMLGKKPEYITADAKVSDKTLTVEFSEQLPRETKYQLVLQNVEAKDGSTLIEPEKINFTTSGGPKVTGINIGRSRVDSSALVSIQFDQKLSGNFDASKYIGLTGGSAIVTRHTSSVSVSLQNLPRCKAFSVNVASGLPSKYGIKAKSAWSYSSRTLCHTVMTYGTSLQGRPLNAYIFGSAGPVTMYAGAIHGNEASSNGLMKAWIEELENNPSKIGNRRIVVIPNINPDGLAANTRNNSRDVNLSRNFPTDNWTKDINDTDGHNKGGGGTKPLSEPEAKALAAITQQYRPRLLLSFHAIGSLVVGDLGGYSASYAAKYASMVGYKNATGEGGTFDYDITGAYEDWSYRNEGIPSMVIELGSYGYYSIDHHRGALWAML